MMSSSVRVFRSIFNLITCGSQLMRPAPRGLRLAAWAALAVAISAASGTPARAQASEVCGLSPAAIKVDERLSATFVGGLVAGEEGRLAVRRAKAGAARLSVWVDFDGDGTWSAGWERIVWNAALREGIEVFELEVPPWAEIGAGTRARFRVEDASGARELTRHVYVGESGTAGCGWASGFFISDFDGWVDALAVYDDGGGAALYAGGSFTTASGIEVNHIAKWDGTGWSALSGPAGTGMSSGAVNALAVYDDGGGAALFAGGRFTTAGGVVVGNIAKWDGTGWSALSGPAGTGTNDLVSALAVYDDGGGAALYAGGWFTTAGGVWVRRIAKWDGTDWSALNDPAGTGASSGVRALAVYDDGGGAALYAGGSFTAAGGVVVDHIAKWDGTGWSALSGPAGTGTSDSVNALAVYDDGGGAALFAGGGFTTAGGVEVNRIAKWDGTGWSALNGPAGTGTNDWISALAVYDDGGGAVLYAGGGLTTAGGVVVIRIAKWDGTGWSALNGPAGTGTNSGVRALAVYDDGGGAALYAGGRFTTAGGVAVNRIAKWDTMGWSALSGPVGAAMDHSVAALAVYDDGGGAALFAGGGFTTAGGVVVHHIAKWDGTSWSALSGLAGTGTNAWVSALAVYDDGGGAALYAGGSFTTAGGVEVHHIAKWDGTSWSALRGPAGTGTSGSDYMRYVYALAVYDDGGGAALFAGGSFTAAGGVVVDHIAKWDGTVWSALSGPAGTGTNDSVHALAVYDDGGGTALYAGGWFTTAGGVEVNHIAKWDGTVWSALSGPAGTGTSGSVRALTVYEDGGGAALFAGGGFTTASGVEVHHIAKWDGTVWSALSGPAGTGTSGSILALAVYDDGGGAALFAGGGFTTAGGWQVGSIARWNGSSWVPLPGRGTNSWVYALATHDDGGGEALFVGGQFTRAGGIWSWNIAKFTFCAEVFSDGFESADTSAWEKSEGSRDR